MALKQSDSRAITVGGEGYRWTYRDNLDVFNLTIQHSNGAGQKLVVNFPRPIREAPPTMTPSVVARCIRLAIAAGWAPEVAGPPLRATLEGETLRTWFA